MTPPSPSYVIVYQPAQGPAQILGRSADANAATVTADTALSQLRKQGRDGEVRVVRFDPEQTVLLRLPLVARPTRFPRLSRVVPAKALVTPHPGWVAASPLKA
jgi:hypothetical protein